MGPPNFSDPTGSLGIPPEFLYDTSGFAYKDEQTAWAGFAGKLILDSQQESHWLFGRELAHESEAGSVVTDRPTYWQ